MSPPQTQDLGAAPPTVRKNIPRLNRTETDQLVEEPATGEKESAQEPEQETVGPVEELVVEMGEEKGFEEIQSDQLPPLPPSRITHNPSGPLHHSTASVCVFPSSMCEKEIHTLSALQGDTDMVLTCLCGCDKVLQTFSIEMDLLQHDKDHAEFALDMSRIELGKGQLNEQHISQKALLQEELVTIRARMCDISREMERVWLDYKRMESELCVFRSHLQHICHFGLPQERSLAQKQIWMMDDILSGLKPNRRRFKALIALHTPTTALRQCLKYSVTQSISYSEVAKGASRSKRYSEAAETENQSNSDSDDAGIPSVLWLH
ncbi:hypothetical protein KOW79_001163 [Hemibagrus wyckioides]|uniref:Pleckstrin homology domain-containing protein n=1 Tax=Hemibagrus wyckioides TaxID=337641 RepID=A0A9D3SVH9_9TELE|nr:hypothetical protein KOW79_001163 [Hemibagrus wyckioides]